MAELLNSIASRRLAARKKAAREATAAANKDVLQPSTSTLAPSASSLPPPPPSPGPGEIVQLTGLTSTEQQHLNHKLGVVVGIRVASAGSSGRIPVQVLTDESAVGSTHEPVMLLESHNLRLMAQAAADNAGFSPPPKAQALASQMANALAQARKEHAAALEAAHAQHKEDARSRQRPPRGRAFSPKFYPTPPETPNSEVFPTPPQTPPESAEAHPESRESAGGGLAGDGTTALDDATLVVLLEQLQVDMQIDWAGCSAARLRTLLQSRGVIGVSAKKLKSLKRLKGLTLSLQDADSTCDVSDGSAVVGAGRSTPGGDDGGPVPSATFTTTRDSSGGGAPTALAPRARTSAEIRARYQAAVDVRLEQLARLTDEKVRRREARLEQLRQRIESLLINEAFEEDEAGMSESMSDLLRSIAARKMAARKMK